MIAFIIAEHGAADVRGAGGVPAAGLSGRLRAGRDRTVVRLPRRGARAAASGPVPGAARAPVRDHGQRHAARGSVLHLHGADPRAQRDGRGPARHDRPAVRAGARRAGVRGDLRRRAARCDHRRGGGLGDLDGADLAADHAALRLRPAAGNRRDRRLGNAGADHSAVAGADRAGRPARPLGGRHVRRRDLPGAGAHQLVRALRARSASCCHAQLRAGIAARSAHAARREAAAPRLASC